MYFYSHFFANLILYPNSIIVAVHSFYSTITYFLTSYFLMFLRWSWHHLLNLIVIWLSSIPLGTLIVCSCYHKINVRNICDIRIWYLDHSDLTWPCIDPDPIHLWMAMYWVLGNTNRGTYIDTDKKTCQICKT